MRPGPPQKSSDMKAVLPVLFFLTLFFPAFTQAQMPTPDGNRIDLSMIHGDDSRQWIYQQIKHNGEEMQLDECSFDDILEFNADGTFNVIIGPNACDGYEEDIHGTWEYLENEGMVDMHYQEGETMRFYFVAVTPERVTVRSVNFEPTLEITITPRQ